MLKNTERQSKHRNKSANQTEPIVFYFLLTAEALESVGVAMEDTS